jgi:hypothetical protein
MSRLTLASVLLAAVASTGLVFGPLGFGSVAADRGVSVSVAGDGDALVGYETDRVEVAGSATVDLVTIENRLASDATVTDVDAATASDAVGVTVSTPGGPIEPGDTGRVRASVDCEPGATTDVTVSVTVEADGVTAAISGEPRTRRFELRCADRSPGLDGARFDGGGNFEFGATDAETVTVTYWTASKQRGDWTVDGPSDRTEVATGEKLNGQVDGGPRFVAVYVHEFDTTYVHPNFDRSATPPIDSWGQGNRDAREEDGRYDPAG